MVAKVLISGPPRLEVNIVLKLWLHKRVHNGQGNSVSPATEKEKITSV